MASSANSRNKVCYYYDSNIGDYYYGEGNPRKPHTIRMAHNLVLNYSLFRKMSIHIPRRATDDDLAKYHSADYVQFLKSIRPDNVAEYSNQMRLFNLGLDCPASGGLYEFCQVTVGGSIDGAIQLNHDDANIAIKWAGGHHHAKKANASGFCYVNDVVLAILELLKYHRRVLYIDIDVHHGDGVEQAFCITDRVMTVSFHEYGQQFFPGTGRLSDVGHEAGKYYAVNVPLRRGIDDESFASIFKSIMTNVMGCYQPEAIVLQCGADSLTGDRLGSFNLTLKGHASCMEFVKKYDLPLLLLGGGGYTMRNVARCWAFETAVAVGTEVSNVLPVNDYYEYFSPTFELHVNPSNMANQNTPKYLDKLKTQVFENLRMLPCAPGVQMQVIPVDGLNVDDSEEDEEANPDERISIRASYKRVTHDNEFSDSEDEGEGGRRDQTSFDKKECRKEGEGEGTSEDGSAEQKGEPVDDLEETTPTTAPGTSQCIVSQTLNMSACVKNAPISMQPATDLPMGGKCDDFHGSLEDQGND